MPLAVDPLFTLQAYKSASGYAAAVGRVFGRYPAGLASPSAAEWLHVLERELLGVLSGVSDDDEAGAGAALDEVFSWYPLVDVAPSRRPLVGSLRRQLSHALGLRAAVSMPLARGEVNGFPEDPDFGSAERGVPQRGDPIAIGNADRDAADPRSLTPSGIPDAHEPYLTADTSNAERTPGPTANDESDGTPRTAAGVDSVANAVGLSSPDARHRSAAPHHDPGRLAPPTPLPATPVPALPPVPLVDTAGETGTDAGTGVMPDPGCRPAGGRTPSNSEVRGPGSEHCAGAVPQHVAGAVTVVVPPPSAPPRAAPPAVCLDAADPVGSLITQAFDDLIAGPCHAIM